MPEADSPRSLRQALLSLRWSGFQSPSEIAAQLDRWSVATVTNRLRSLASDGLLWSIVEIGETRTLKFAHVRNDVALLIVPAGQHRAWRRVWQPAGRPASTTHAPRPILPAQICAGSAGPEVGAGYAGDTAR